MARQLVGKKYKNMPEGYRDRVSQDEFRERRTAQRMAGKRMETRKDIVQGYGQLSPEKQEEYGSRQEFRDARKEFKNENPYAVDKLEDFDLRATGAGGARGPGAKGLDTTRTADDKLGRGKARLSKQDLLRLQEKGGFGKQELIDFAENKVTRDFGEGTGGYGGAAAGLLEKWKTEIMNAEAAENSNINPEPPGTKPGVDEIPDDTNDGGNIADAPSITAPLPAGIGNIVGDTGDISLQDSTIFGDINTGTMNTVKYYGGGMGSGSGSPYDSALGLAQQYMDNQADNFDENAGMKITGQFQKMREMNKPVDYNDLLNKAHEFTSFYGNIANVYDAMLYGPQRDRASTADFVMAGEPFADQFDPEDLKDFT